MEFERDRPFINSISTNALLEGLVLADHPEHFTTPYASDTPPPPRYDWSRYQHWLKASRELLVLIRALLEPNDIPWLTIPQRYADIIDRIPDMTEKHRADVIRNNTSATINTALKAAIEATGGFSKILAPTPDLVAILDRSLRRSGIDADIPPAVRRYPLPYRTSRCPTQRAKP